MQNESKFKTTLAHGVPFNEKNQGSKISSSCDCPFKAETRITVGLGVLVLIFACTKLLYYAVNNFLLWCQVA
jgi:hypothetical protein